MAKLGVDLDASCIITHAYQPCLLHTTPLKLVISWCTWLCNPGMTDMALDSVAMVQSVRDECLRLMASKHGSASSGCTSKRDLSEVCVACSKYQRRAESQLSSRDRKLLFIIVDLSPVTDIDASAVHFLMVTSI